MKGSPAILVTTPASPVEENVPDQKDGQDKKEEKIKISAPEPSPLSSPSISRMSFLNVDDERRPQQQQRGGSLAAIRRHTVMLARDMFMRRLSRNDSTSSQLKQKLTLEDFGKFVNEVNHMLAVYRQMTQTVGTHSELAQTRKELSSCRRQCLRTCESAKECILPLLKENTTESHGSSQTSELARHSCHQFIGCLSMFAVEMRRTEGLLRALSSAGSGAQPTQSMDNATDVSSYCTAAGSSVDVRLENELEALSRDLKEAETMLETLENAITVHFSTEPSQQAGLPLAAPKSKKSSRKYSKLCVYFKTKYA